MAKNIGLQCFKNGDFYELAINDNDVVVGNTLYQNQAFLLRAEKGDFKEDEQIGVGMINILNDENPTELKQEIINQFKKEGLRITKLILTPQKFEIVADYKD